VKTDGELGMEGKDKGKEGTGTARHGKLLLVICEGQDQGTHLVVREHIQESFDKAVLVMRTLKRKAAVASFGRK